MKRDKKFYSRLGIISHAKRRGTAEYEEWRKRRVSMGKEMDKIKKRDKFGHWIKQ